MEVIKKQSIFTNIIKKWPIILWLGGACYFFILPAFLLQIGLENYSQARNRIEEREAYKKLGLKLEMLLQYGDARHYYHSLLKKIFDIAESQKDSVAYLEEAIPHLKNRNPGAFTCIVWDNETDTLVEKLTDEKGHRYVLKTLNEVFLSLLKENENAYPVKPEKIGYITKKMSIIRSYIGNLMIPECLNIPLLRANLGKVVPVSARPEKSFFWFQSGKKITLMVFISQEAMSSLSYVDKLVNGLNKNFDGIIKFGMVDLLHNKEIIPETSEAEIAELKLGLIKYDNYSNQKISTNNYLMLIKILNPFMRCFCYIPKKTVYKYESLPNKSLFFAVCLVIIFYFGLWGLYKYTSVKFSLRWKLSLIFLYANGLPLLGLGFIGYDYLQQNKSIQLQEVYENISLLINDFDSKFGLIKKDYTDKLNCIINEINSNYSNKNLKKTLYEKLKKEVADSGYSDFFVGSIDGKSVITGDGSKSDGFFFDVFASILKFASNKVYTSIKAFEKDEKDINFSSMYDKDIVFFHTIISKIGLISLERLLDSFYYYYFNFVGNTKERDFREIVVVRWSVSQLQENYVKGYLKKLNTNTQNIKCFAFSESNGTIFPEDKLENKELITRFGQILNLNSLSFEEVIIDNRAYAGFGSVGVELDKIAVIGLYPVDLINAKINNIRIKLIWFAIASLLLTLSICRFLSIYFLLPIKDLQSGIEAMKRQDFSYRLPIKTGDEFGELNTVFNNAFESLEELAVATTVQENLFPLKPLLQNDCYVYGKSVTMTRLGGDYFDYFPIGENGIGVLMGDVAGHGIPAGFLMAMAKASVLLSGEEKKQPSKLLASIHKVFHHVKSKKIIRMMTCVYFSINTLTGEYKVVNAGHCYPVVVTKTRKAEFIELDGSPLGITKRPRYVDYDGVLENDSFLLLYTDGILEARNEFGEQMGPTRFLELVNNNYADEPEEYYKNIFAEYKAWSPLADDDITMVLVKIKLNKEIKS